MCFLPQGNELIEVRCRDLQDVFHIIALGIAGANRIAAIRLGYSSHLTRLQVYDDLCLSVESMHVTRFVVLWIGEKSHTVEPQ
jgi:hypothetical protein